jgi:hypothetical protein
MLLAVITVEAVNESADIAVVVSLTYVVIESFAPRMTCHLVIPFDCWSNKLLGKTIFQFVGSSPGLV